MPFQFKRLSIPEVVALESLGFKDGRVLFAEIYKQTDFKVGGIEAPFAQDNCSYSAQGVLRGLYYQKQPKAQGKLVIAPRGRIFDVAKRVPALSQITAPLKARGISMCEQA